MAIKKQFTASELKEQVRTNTKALEAMNLRLLNQESLWSPQVSIEFRENLKNVRELMEYNRRIEYAKAEIEKIQSKDGNGSKSLNKILYGVGLILAAVAAIMMASIK